MWCKQVGISSFTERFVVKRKCEKALQRKQWRSVNSLQLFCMKYFAKLCYHAIQLKTRARFTLSCKEIRIVIRKQNESGYKTHTVGHHCVFWLLKETISSGQNNDEILGNMSFVWTMDTTRLIKLHKPCSVFCDHPWGLPIYKPRGPRYLISEGVLLHLRSSGDSFHQSNNESVWTVNMQIDEDRVNEANELECLGRLPAYVDK